MKQNIGKLINDAGVTTYEGNSFWFFNSILCDRERLPESITSLLPKVIYKQFIPWEEIDNFANRSKNWLAEHINPGLELSLEGSFYKLSGVSSKDSSIPRFISCEVVKNIVEDSLRWYGSLMLYKKYRIGTYLWFLEWLDDCSIDKEVRIFIKDYEVQGVSAYNYKDKVYNFTDDFMEQAKLETEQKIIKPLVEPPLFKREWDLSEFVIDAYQRADGSLKFLEVNPYWHSDPCCYWVHKNIGTPLFCRID